MPLDALDPVLFVIADILILATFIISVVFVVSYRYFFNYKLTKAGRAVLRVFQALIAVSLLSGVTRYLGQDYFGRGVLRILVWTFAAYTVGRLLWVLWSNWRNDRPILDVPAREHRRPITEPIQTQKEQDPS